MYKWAWLIGSIRDNYFREMLVEGQSAKYLRLENIALYGICIIHIIAQGQDERGENKVAKTAD